MKSYVRAGFSRYFQDECPKNIDSVVAKNLKKPSQAPRVVSVGPKDGLSVIATKLDNPLMLDSYTSDMCIQSYGRLSYARALIPFRADVELKENTVVAMPKIDKCPKNKDSGVVKNMKKPSQTHRGVSVGPKVVFKPAKNVDSSSTSTTPIVAKIDKMKRLIIDGKVTLVDDEGKLLTREIGYGTNSLLEQWKESYGNGDYNYDSYDDDMYEFKIFLTRFMIYVIIWISKFVWKKPFTQKRNEKKDVEPTKEVSNSNPFDVLNSIENVVDLGINGVTSNLASKKANFSGFSFWDVETSSTSTTLIKETYANADYDYDPYDDDVYEGQEIPNKIQSICDNLDIKVRGRKKK
ncbi:hypothetical protein Tco_0140042 [Tanacetum coccineum]